MDFRNAEAVVRRGSSEEVPKNFAMFTGKHLCWSLFLIKIIKNRLQHRCFPVKFPKFLRTISFTEDMQWLLLEISHELSLYCICGRWMVSFRGTYWFPSSFCCVCFVSFYFFLFFLFFVWTLLLTEVLR